MSVSSGQSLIGTILSLKGPHEVQYSDQEWKILRSTTKIGILVVGFGIFGDFWIGVACYGQSATWTQFSYLLGSDLLLASAAAAAGAMAGFIFGIPRTLDAATHLSAVGMADAKDTTAASRAVLASNTNLEQISDKLTTLLIGATLVQIAPISAWVYKIGQGFSVTALTSNVTLAPISMVYFAILGFMGSYLATRLFLTFAFAQTLGLLVGGIGAKPEAPEQDNNSDQSHNGDNGDNGGDGSSGDGGNGGNGSKGGNDGRGTEGDGGESDRGGDEVDGCVSSTGLLKGEETPDSALPKAP